MALHHLCLFAKHRTDIYMHSPSNSSDIRLKWDAFDARSFDAPLKSVPFAAFQQFYAYGEAVAAFGGKTHRVQIFAGDTLIGAAQIQARDVFGLFSLATIMLGPVWLDEVDDATTRNALKAIRTELPIAGRRILMLMPNFKAKGDIDAPSPSRYVSLKRGAVISPYHSALIELTLDEDALLKNMDGKWRNRLRAAQKSDVRINALGKRPAQYEWLLDEERKQRGRAGYTAVDPKFVPVYQQFAGEKSVLALEAKDGQERCGGVLFLRHGDCATYHIGWTSDRGKDLKAHNALLWEGMRLLKRRGVKLLDLGGLDTDQSPGIARFKIGAGGKPVSQPGVYALSLGGI